MGRTFAVASVILLSQLALAGLTQPESSVDSDRVKFKGKKHQIVDHGTYRVHSIDRENGGQVTEYVANDKVFGVAWSGGNSHPNMSTLLNSRYNSFMQQLSLTSIPTPGKATGVRSSPISVIKTDDLIVERWGHMGKVQGRAWVPSLLPNGVSSDEVH
jgi:hypothetical protein